MLESTHLKFTRTIAPLSCSVLTCCVYVFRRARRPVREARAPASRPPPEEAQDGDAEADAEPRVQRVAHLRGAERRPLERRAPRHRSRLRQVRARALLHCTVLFTNDIQCIVRYTR